MRAPASCSLVRSRPPTWQPAPLRPACRPARSRVAARAPGVAGAAPPVSPSRIVALADAAVAVCARRRGRIESFALGRGDRACSRGRVDEVHFSRPAGPARRAAPPPEVCCATLSAAEPGRACTSPDSVSRMRRVLRSAAMAPPGKTSAPRRATHAPERRIVRRDARRRRAPRTFPSSLLARARRLIPASGSRAARVAACERRGGRRIRDAPALADRLADGVRSARCAASARTSARRSRPPPRSARSAPSLRDWPCRAHRDSPDDATTSARRSCCSTAVEAIQVFLAATPTRRRSFARRPRRGRPSWLERRQNRPRRPAPLRLRAPCTDARRRTAGAPPPFTREAVRRARDQRRPRSARGASSRRGRARRRPASVRARERSSRGRGRASTSLGLAREARASAPPRRARRMRADARRASADHGRCGQPRPRVQAPGAAARRQRAGACSALADRVRARRLTSSARAAPVPRAAARRLRPARRGRRRRAPRGRPRSPAPRERDRGAGRTQASEASLAARGHSARPPRPCAAASPRRSGAAAATGLATNLAWPRGPLLQTRRGTFAVASSGQTVRASTSARRAATLPPRRGAHRLAASPAFSARAAGSPAPRRRAARALSGRPARRTSPLPQLALCGPRAGFGASALPVIGTFTTDSAARRRRRIRARNADRGAAGAARDSLDVPARASRASSSAAIDFALGSFRLCRTGRAAARAASPRVGLLLLRQSRDGPAAARLRSRARRGRECARWPWRRRPRWSRPRAAALALAGAVDELVLLASSTARRADCVNGLRIPAAIGAGAFRPRFPDEPRRARPPALTEFRGRALRRRRAVSSDALGASAAVGDAVPATLRWSWLRLDGLGEHGGAPFFRGAATRHLIAHRQPGLRISLRWRRLRGHELPW